MSLKPWIRTKTQRSALSQVILLRKPLLKSLVVISTLLHLLQMAKFILGVKVSWAHSVTATTRVNNYQKKSRVCKTLQKYRQALSSLWF